MRSRQFNGAAGLPKTVRPMRPGAQLKRGQAFSVTQPLALAGSPIATARPPCRAIAEEHNVVNRCGLKNAGSPPGREDIFGLYPGLQRMCHFWTAWSREEFRWDASAGAEKEECWPEIRSPSKCQTGPYGKHGPVCLFRNQAVIVLLMRPRAVDPQNLLKHQKFLPFSGRRGHHTQRMPQGVGTQVPPQQPP